LILDVFIVIAKYVFKRNFFQNYE